jgi:signal transduction histidine kinase
VKILITGRKDKYWQAIGAAFAHQSGLAVSMIPAGSALVEALNASQFDAVLYTISRTNDIELLRWVIKINPLVAIIAIIPAKEARLHELLHEEGVTQIVEVAALGSTQVRSSVAPLLRRLGSGSGNEARQLISNDLHVIRSTLTGILGNAEMALKRAKAPASRKQLEEIPRGVAEIERIIRRLHRTLRMRPLETPGSRRSNQ